MKEPNHDITPQEQMAEAMQAERPGEAQPAAPKEEKPSLWIECYTLLHDPVSYTHLGVPVRLQPPGSPSAIG